jgi:peptidoglycan L-alanyl-D-glutamate endopeptidase CwlK
VINSRKIEDLLPVVQPMVRAFLSRCEAEGIDLLVTSTYRDHESQAALYAQGRTTNGARVTNAKPGQSWHNWKCALDVVPLRNGKPVWGTTLAPDKALWERVIAIGEACGLESLARSSFPEMAHFQYRGGLTIADMMAGKVIE